MSLFAGVLHEPGRQAQRHELEAALQALIQVAPVQAGLRLGGALGLAHGQLPVNPRAHHGQAIVERDGLTLAGDVRLDQRAALVRELEQHSKGPLVEASDLQLLHAAWLKWGKSLLEHISGDFSFILWDAETQGLFAARDQLGIKPFYYHQAGNAVWFGNALNLFHHFAAVNMAQNRQALADYLLFGYCPSASATSFEHVRQLEPGHCLSIEAGRLQIQRYWEMPLEPPLTGLSDEELVERFSAELQRAVSDRLGSGPVNIPFSGGMDSGAIAALSRISLGEQGASRIRLVHAYASGGKDNEMVQSLAAFASNIGADFEARHLGEAEYFSRSQLHGWPTPEVWWQHDRVVAQPHLELLAAFAPLALTGQGGDLMFCQNYRHMERLRRNGPWRIWFGEALAFFRMHSARPPLGLKLRSGLAERYGPDTTPKMPLWLHSSAVNELDLKTRLQKQHEIAVRKQLPERHPRAEFVAGMQSPYWQYVLGGHNPQVTGIPIEFRHPFFDLGLAQLMARVVSPKWFRDKALLRIAMHGRLPTSVLTRPKQLHSPRAFKQNYLDTHRSGDAVGALGENSVAGLINQTVFADLVLKATQLSSEEFLSLSRVLIANDWSNSLE